MNRFHFEALRTGKHDRSSGPVRTIRYNADGTVKSDTMQSVKQVERARVSMEEINKLSHEQKLALIKELKGG